VSTTKVNANVPRRSYAIDPWGKVQKGPEDPILGVTVAFNKDTNPNKINLGVGAYRDDNGKPFILSAVKKVCITSTLRHSEALLQAEKRIFDSNMNHEYAPIAGIPEFNKVAQVLQLGENSPVIKEKRVGYYKTFYSHRTLSDKYQCSVLQLTSSLTNITDSIHPQAVTIQALSGTGALRVGAQFLNRFLDFPSETKNTVYLPNPTWGNHNPIFQDSGFGLKQYRYYDSKSIGLDFEGLKADVKVSSCLYIVLTIA
jgi:aspartate aminotransferase